MPMTENHQTALPQFIKKMNDLDKQFREALFESNHVPHKLFQYTDAHGLKSLLENTKWRATHYRYLNDGKEIMYAHEMISGFLMERLKVEQDEILKRYMRKF